MKATVRSFDGTETASGELQRPDRYRLLLSLLDQGKRVIPRGSGLSYCCASAGQGVVSVESHHFNRILALDAERGFIDVEAGLTVGGLLRFLVPRGWYLPVLPGHPQITIGGCIGCNVHGKSQLHSGCFIDAIEALQLFHPEHGEQWCSRQQRKQLFELTVGGFGLTGFITRARLRLGRLPGSSLEVRRVTAADLVEAVEVMEELAGGCDGCYSWNDLNRHGGSFGAGIVFSEHLTDTACQGRVRHRRLGPDTRSSLPVSLLNRLTVPMMTRLYGLAQALGPASSSTRLEIGAFPINGKEIYYTLFGRPGLREYQALLPRRQWPGFVAGLQGAVRRFGEGVALGSLKLFSGRSSLLRFCGDGVCIAIDVAATPAAILLFGELDELVAAAGGIVNLAKDSRIGAATVRRMFHEYDRFRQLLHDHDPQHRFDSALRRRVLDD